MKKSVKLNMKELSTILTLKKKGGQIPPRYYLPRIIKE